MSEAQENPVLNKPVKSAEDVFTSLRHNISSVFNPDEFEVYRFASDIENVSNPVQAIIEDAHDFFRDVKAIERQSIFKAHAEQFADVLEDFTYVGIKENTLTESEAYVLRTSLAGQMRIFAPKPMDDPEYKTQLHKELSSEEFMAVMCPNRAARLQAFVGEGITVPGA